METFYYVIFAAIAVGCAGLELSNMHANRDKNTIVSAAFSSFRSNYLVV